MTGRDFLRKIWHRLPGTVKKTIWSVYLSCLEIATLPRDIWGTSHLSVSKLDYEEYWEKRGMSSVQPRHNLIAAIVDDECSVLDIGCGDGFLMDLLTKERGARCKGYDISETSVRLARERGLDAIVADVLTDEFSVDSVYDYVVVCELLEHVSNPEKLMAKLRGTYEQALIVSVPNSAYFKYRLRLLFGRFPTQWLWHPSEHLRYWSVRDFYWWAGELGMEVKRVLPATGVTLFNLNRLLPNLFAHDVVYILI